MDTDIIKADTLEEYGRFFGVETRHPQVGVCVSTVRRISRRTG